MKELRALDRDFHVFGSKRGKLWGHGYQFNKPLKESEVVRFEKQHGIVLPKDYREFVTVVGDGGAGPHYGIKTLKEASEATDLSVKFPWSEETELVSDEDCDCWERSPGVLIIAERGCAYTDFLVVNGEAYGEVWSDFTAVDEPLSPTHASFYDWYLEWAKRCIKTIKREALIDQVEIGMTIDEVQAILGYNMQRWTGAANLPDSPSYYISFTNTNASFSMGVDNRVKAVNKMS